MVTVIDEQCKGCGTCIDICHESCMFLADGKISIDYDLCSTCTQCIAICPQRALLWNGIDPEPFNDELLPLPGQMDELFKQRRTVRHFTTDKPGRRLLRQIINCGAYAPSHSHDFRVIAIDDRNLLDQINRTAFEYNRKIYKYLYKSKLAAALIRWISSSSQYREYRKAAPKLQASLESGKGYKCMPPAIIFIVGSKRIPLSLESAQYLLYNMDLYARSKGLGCRNLVGNQFFFNHSRLIRRTLGIGGGEKIFAAFGIGYPLKKFNNKVQGRELFVQWNAPES